MKYLMPYVRFCPRFWIDEKVSALSTEDAKNLLFYILTCPHRTVEGLFRLPKPYICADLGWSLERLAEPFEELLAKGFIRYDETVSVILIVNALKYQYPENPNQIKSALNKLAELPKTPLLDDLQVLAQGLAEGLAEGFGKPPSPSPTPSPEPPSSAKEKERRTFPEDSIEFHLCRVLRGLILVNRPGAKVPADLVNGLAGWCREMDLIIRVDGRDPAEVEMVIRWSQADSFWKTNILSPSSLRKHYDELAMKMEAGDNGQGKGRQPSNSTPSSRTHRGSRGK